MIAFPASLLILNGKSADNLPLRDAIAQLRNESVEIHVRVTWKKAMHNVTLMKRSGWA